MRIISVQQHMNIVILLFYANDVGRDSLCDTGISAGDFEPSH